MPVPEQPAPLQPLNVDPLEATAVSVTTVPCMNAVEQLPDPFPLATEQLIAEGLDVTTPSPVPAPLTVNENVG